MSALSAMAQLLSMGRPQTYYGTQTADQVNADAARAQQAALQQSDISSRNYGYDRDFWKGINQMMSDQKIQEMRSASDQSLAGLNNAAALQRAQMETESQRYGYDNQLQAAMANYANQSQIAAMNNAANRYQTDVNAQTQLGATNLQGQYGLQQALIPQQFRQQRFDSVFPLLGGILGQYMGGGQQQPTAYGAPLGAPAPTSQPPGASRPSGFNPDDFWHQNYARAVAEGRLPQGAPLPYSPDSGQVETYLQQYVGGNKSAAYGSAPTMGVFLPGQNGSEISPQPQQQNATAYGPANAYANANIGGGTQSGFSSLQSSAPGNPQNAYSQAASNQISTGPVISDQQQNQMLNSALGANAQSANQAMRNAQTSFGSRGWSPSSPALRSYQNRIGMNQMLADTQARMQIPMQAAKTNADYSLQAQQGNLAAGNQRLGALSGYYSSQSNMLSPILSALVSMGS